MRSLLVPFETARAGEVGGWARTDAEAAAWCSYDRAPVPAEVVEGWSSAPGVVAYGLLLGTELVGYGELWVDDDECEVELAHLIVAPAHRGHGLGRVLTELLVDAARLRHPQVFLRVLPDNVVAQRAYAAAGFARVSAQLEQAWNSGQPVQYVWMAR